jgi:class 3 adenylate cyclase
VPPPSSPAVHKTIMVVDVADFTNPVRTEAHHKAMVAGMYRALEEAFDESGIDWTKCQVEDRGDGAMILIPADVPKTLLADRLLDRLVAGLHDHNAIHAIEAAVHLRVGLHAGEVSDAGNGVIGHAVNYAFRILDAKAAKTALRNSGGTVALIVSDAFYQEVIRQNPSTHPRSYQRIPVAIKGFSADAWLRLPDGTPMAPSLPGPRAAPEPPGEHVPGEKELGLLPNEELEHLAELISDLTVANLPLVVRRAAGPAVAIPATDNAWEVFLQLNDVMAGPDAIPPALLFLELFTGQVAEPLKSKLTEWIAQHARGLRVETALADWRDGLTPIPAAPRLHLLIAVEQAVPGAPVYQLSFWRQDDPNQWPPMRGAIRLVTLDELERRVDDVVLDAERNWAGLSALVTLEFVLPRALLQLPVHRWGKEHESGYPKPLCLDYEIVIRSLERMKHSYWHRVWNDRWNTLQADPSTTRIYYGVPQHLETPFRIDAVLSNRRWVSMVLTAAPAPEPPPVPGVDELTAALRSGLPVLIWHADAEPDELGPVVDRLVGQNGLAALPAQASDSRRGTFLTPSDDFNIDLAGDLVVMWDDPTRIIALDQPPIPTQP